jgi:hypothetical protein
VLGAAADGAWDLTSQEMTRSVAWMPAMAAQGSFRVLWVGDPAVLPLDGWPLDGQSGVAYATSRNGAPDVTNLLPGPPSGATKTMGDVLRVAEQGGTARLGRLLAPMAVRYIVVPRRLSAADTTSGDVPPPASLTRALDSQLDLRVLPSDPSLDVYENVSWGPVRAELPAALAAQVPTGLGAGADLTGSTPVLGGRGPVRFAGQLPAPGTVLLSESPSPRWTLTVGGHTVSRAGAFGVANMFTTTQTGTARLGYRTPLLRWPLAVLPFVLWALAVAALWRSRRRPAPPEPDTQLIPVLAGAGIGPGV